MDTPDAISVDSQDSDQPGWREVEVPPLGLSGTLRIPHNAQGIVLFAHGSGSSRFSPRNIAVAHQLNERGFATFLLDLLTEPESEDRQKVFDIPLLAERLVQAVRWIDADKEVGDLRLGLFGASTGAGAALVAAAELGERVSAVVSRGGRPDLADSALSRVLSPTLLIVGGADTVVVGLNREALAQLNCEKALTLVPDATHLFEEAGALEAVTLLAAGWFQQYLVPQPGTDRQLRAKPA
ncbi:MAG: dienelactone hydrolase family protein [Lacisediminihabitans sp.]